MIKASPKSTHEIVQTQLKLSSSLYNLQLQWLGSFVIKIHANKKKLFHLSQFDYSISQVFFEEKGAKREA